MQLMLFLAGRSSSCTCQPFKCTTVQCDWSPGLRCVSWGAPRRHFHTSVLLQIKMVLYEGYLGHIPNSNLTAIGVWDYMLCHWNGARFQRTPIKSTWMDFKLQLKKAQVPVAEAGLFICYICWLERLCKKEEKRRYVVMEVQPHPFIIVTPHGHAVPDWESYIYNPCIEQRIWERLEQ